jgi:hypothetical protein
MSKKVDISKFNIQNANVPLKSVCYGCGYLIPGKAAHYKCHVAGSCPAVPPRKEDLPRAAEPTMVFTGYVIVSHTGMRYLRMDDSGEWVPTGKVQIAEVFSSRSAAQKQKTEILRDPKSYKKTRYFLTTASVQPLSLSVGPAEEPSPLDELDPELAGLITNFQEAAGNSYYQDDQGNGRAVDAAAEALGQSRQDLVAYLKAHLPEPKPVFTEPRVPRQGWMDLHPTSRQQVEVVEARYVNWLESYVKHLDPSFETLQSKGLVKKPRYRANTSGKSTRDTET